MSVSLRHPLTGEIRVMQDGWSWSCFLGSGLLGLPLFRRGLLVWGSVMVTFNFVTLAVAFSPSERAATLYGWLSIVGTGLSIFFGLKANAMAIDRCLSLGWQFAERR